VLNENSGKLGRLSSTAVLALGSYCWPMRWSTRLPCTKHEIKIKNSEKKLKQRTMSRNNPQKEGESNDQFDG